MADASQEQLNVLVVDDDPAMRDLLAQIVLRAGHQAVVAESAEKALELLPVWSFQIAFLDQNLPGMEGVLLGEYLRRSNPNMTLALVTGEDDPKLRRRLQELGVTYIAKPFDVSQIHDVLGAYVDRALAQAEQRAQQAGQDFDPPFGQYADDLAECYGIPKVPDRVADRVVSTVQRCLHNLRSVSRYSERDRVVALSGLLAARVLGIDLPRAPGGATLYEEYDRLMQQHGRRAEFAGGVRR